MLSFLAAVLLLATPAMLAVHPTGHKRVQQWYALCFWSPA